MGQSFEEILTDLLDLWNADYPSDLERYEAQLKALRSAVQAMLEKLRDFDARKIGIPQ